MPKGPAAKKDGSAPAVSAAALLSTGEPAEGPARGSPGEWGGIAMLAHCAQTVEEDTVPAVAPPAASRGHVGEIIGIKPLNQKTGLEPDDANYSRKEKSLGLLCDKFLQEYSSAAEVCLDAAAKRLGVERRRIYDIVNVLESVEVVSRKAKNRYIWYGVTRLPQALQRQYMLGPPEHDKSEEDESEGSDNEGEGGAAKSSAVPGKRTSRREKSLGVLSQKFVRLFLHAQCGVVSLESAARRLMDETVIDENRLKTKIRRLYDIANILCSLNLIEKTHLADGSRKPAFKWKYPCKHLGLDTGAELINMGLKPEVRSDRAEGKRSSTDGLAGPAKRSKKEKKRSSGGLSASGQMMPSSIPSMGSPLVGGAMHPALMMSLLNSMNTTSTVSTGNEPAGGAAGGAQMGLAGMLDSPKDMQAYMQAYFAQMAGMQSMLTQLATVKPPDGEGIKEDSKVETKDADPVDSKEAADAKEAAVALAGAGGLGLGAGAGSDVMMPTYLQMMCAWMGQFQTAGGAATSTSKVPGMGDTPPPPPPPGGGPTGLKVDDLGEGSAAAALSLGLDPNASSMPLMPEMDLQSLQNAAAMWQMMSAGAIPLGGAGALAGALPGGDVPAPPSEVGAAAPPPPPADGEPEAQAAPMETEVELKPDDMLEH